MIENKSKLFAFLEQKSRDYFQNIISKTSKQIVLNFETNFTRSKITIERCIEALLSSAIPLSKNWTKAFKLRTSYENLECIIRDITETVKIVPTPSYLLKQLILGYMLKAEKAFPSDVLMF